MRTAALSVLGEGGDGVGSRLPGALVTDRKRSVCVDALLQLLLFGPSAVTELQ